MDAVPTGYSTVRAPPQRGQTMAALGACNAARMAAVSSRLNRFSASGMTNCKMRPAEEPGNSEGGETADRGI